MESKEESELRECLEGVLREVAVEMAAGKPTSDMRKHRLFVICGIVDGEFSQCIHYSPTCLGNCSHLSEFSICTCGIGS